MTPGTPPVRLYDTKAQALRDFVPLDPSHVSVYVCGPTVQSGPHIGHLRGALSFDILRRWLAHRFGRVTFVRNVTDIDDKVLANATDTEPWWALAYRMEMAFSNAYAAIGIAPPTYEPRATASIPQMQELIERLIDAGHAYAANGDVYFDVRSWREYGTLTRQSLDAMEPAQDADPRGKRDPRDFALWKGAKAEEPESARWASPWGTGRPGWHIECSAMSRRYLGPEFDIHGGGLDLRFPHHENELAQSTAAGDAFARYWVHNGLVTVGDQKMSKSLDNFLLADDVLRERDPLVIRYALAAAHYRSSLDISASSFDEAEAALERIRSFLERAVRTLQADSDDLRIAATVPERFAAAMDDDLGVPQALAVLHETVRAGNTALDEGDREATTKAFADVAIMTGVLGIDPLDPAWQSAPTGAEAVRSRRPPPEPHHPARRRARRQRLGRGRSHPRRHRCRGHHARRHERRNTLEYSWPVASRGARAPARARRAPPRARAARTSARSRVAGRRPRPRTAPGTPRASARPRPSATPPQAARASPPGRRSRVPRAAKKDDDTEVVTGRNSVLEALRAKIPATAFYIAQRVEMDDRVKEMLSMATHRQIPVMEVTRPELDRMAGFDGVHQGVALKVPPYEYAHPQDLLESVIDKGQTPLFVALDGITDPRNLGAIIRSTGAFGGHGVILPQRRSASVNSAAWKTSAGAAARIPVAIAPNLTSTLKEFKKQGVFVLGLDGGGDVSLPALELADRPVVIVVGSEGKGLSRLVSETCDQIVSIPIDAATESLNAGIAASVALYQVSTLRVQKDS